MRKLLAFLMSALLMLSLAACSGCSGDPEPGASSAPEISDPNSVGVSDVSDPTGDSKDPTATTTGTKAPSSSNNKTSSASSNNKTSSASSNKKTSATTSAKTTAAAPTNTESPVTINTAILWNGQTSSYDAKAETLRKSILNAKDTVKATTDGTTRYVSYKGNDKNDGLTPATAWRTVTRAAGALANSTILFERGGVYRGTMNLKNGMSVGAYGTGAKPQLYASPQNYADESLWKKTNTANVWRLDVGKAVGDVGNIIFDYGKECASIGKQRYAEYLKKDFDFLSDTSNGYLYLYLSKGNPGKLYKSIEITPKKALLGKISSNLQNITVDNLCLKYANFGIALDGITNLPVTNSAIGWNGGSMLNADVRYGNGIELFGKVEGAKIENNWIYQCYDAGYTNQDNGNRIQNNITVKNNLIEYCNYNIEVFVGASKGGKVTNTVYEKNVLRFAGYGFGSYNRIGSDTSQVGHIRATINSDGCPSENFIIRNNIFDCSAYQLVNSSRYDGVKGPLFTGNTWIQNGAKNASTARVYKGSDSYPSYLPAGNLETMKASVAIVDKNATVIFE